MFPEVPQPAHTQKLRATETARIQIVKAPTHTPSLREQRISENLTFECTLEFPRHIGFLRCRLRYKMSLVVVPG